MSDADEGHVLIGIGGGLLAAMGLLLWIAIRVFCPHRSSVPERPINVETYYNNIHIARAFTLQDYEAAAIVPAV